MKSTSLSNHGRNKTGTRSYRSQHTEHKASSNTKKTLPLFFIDLEPKESNKSTYEIKYLCNMKTTVEAPRKKHDVVQRTRCQCYGHTETYCARPYTCAKCGGEHNTTSCKENPNPPAKCALCGGNHPANYKSCDMYRNKN
jgi:hypothetical protein